ncbi:MAG TPA: hypothetical protein VK527_09860 [Candidatus Limnocylindrales bacterium]|nr:hypothetical protein [Candidatus Limnocylindrales bacterium]
MKVHGFREFALAAIAAALALLAVSAWAREEAPPPAPAPAAAHQHGRAAEKPPASQGKYMTIVGEVMDPACFLEAGVKSIGTGHYQCAIDCARSGQTLAIYDREEDRIYFIAGELPGKNPNDPVMAYIHKKVDVSGTVYHRADAYGIVITKVVLHQDKPGSGKAGASAAGVPAGK